MAGVLASGPSAVLSHRSAASLWKLTAPRPVSDPVDVLVPGNRKGGRAGIRVHRVRSLNPEERTVLAGIPVTTPARTLVDLAGVSHRRELELAIARAEREDLVDARGLEVLLTLYKGRRGLPVLRALIRDHGGPAFTRSEAERRFLELIREAGLPAPETNVIVAGREVDFLWRSERIAVEVDGYRYHSSRSRFESDRRRMTHLAAHGVQVIPLTWRQIVEERVATAVQLGLALQNPEP